MIFKPEIGLFETTPQTLFLTNQEELDKLYDFLIKTKFIKLFNDFSLNHEHLLDSPIFSYMMRNNTQSKTTEDGKEVCILHNIVNITEKD